MKITALRIFLTFMIVFFCIYLNAQEKTKQKNKIYETWISLDNKPNTLKGVLYEINDSSIFVSNSKLKKDYSTGNFKVSEIYYNRIDVMKTRRKYSIEKGTLIGEVAGLAILIAATSGEGFSPRELAFIGLPFAAIGAGIGALAGSIKVIIPINNSFENFNKNKNKLQKYSYVQEYSHGANISGPTYEHKSYIGFLLGPSFPLGEFADNSEGNENAGLAKTGYCSNVVNIGYRITQKLGVSAFAFYSQYDVDKNGSEMWWGISGIMAGPMFSIPVNNKLYFDLKPRIGFVSAQFLVNDNAEEFGKGLGINLNASLLYNFSKRWCILTETGYISSHQKFWDSSEKKIQAINLGLGIAYRFR